MREFTGLVVRGHPVDAGLDFLGAISFESDVAPVLRLGEDAVEGGRLGIVAGNGACD
jgi:hypothetical protein